MILCDDGTSAIGHVLIPNDDVELRFGSGQELVVKYDGTDAVYSVTSGGHRFDGGPLLHGTATAPSAGGSKVLVFGDNAADPTMGADTAGLYAKDVAGTVELWAVDEASNATQLSPHDPETGEWVFFTKNLRTGKIRRIHMDALVEAIEELTGRSFTEEWIDR